MLLVIDRDDWLNTYDTIEAVEDDLEWQDVVDAEYSACDETGRIYRFYATDKDYQLRATEVVDPSIPRRFFLRFAAKYRVRDEVALQILSETGDYATSINRIVEIRWPKKKTH